MNEVFALLAFTVFLIGSGAGFYQFMIKPLGKAHYQTIDKEIVKGVLSRHSTREEVKQWIKQYDARPTESQITDTLNYISSQRSLRDE